MIINSGFHPNPKNKNVMNEKQSKCRVKNFRKLFNTQFIFSQMHRPHLRKTPQIIAKYPRVSLWWAWIYPIWYNLVLLIFIHIASLKLCEETFNFRGMKTFICSNLDYGHELKKELPRNQKINICGFWKNRKFLAWFEWSKMNKNGRCSQV